MYFYFYNMFNSCHLSINTKVGTLHTHSLPFTLYILLENELFNIYTLLTMQTLLCATVSITLLSTTPFSICSLETEFFMFARKHKARETNKFLSAKVYTFFIAPHHAYVK